ncbi:unnamed protein product [marine sediment metagenome]|uniref:Clp1 P-loop domain-containing protein n=1 Tax=marine sediment metagenome TaxID=412755 RepID=X1CIK4_9ZZZZ
MVLGATDTGKSICTLLFAKFWVKHGRKVGIVDVDMGQSDLGPPTTIGMVLINKPIKNLAEVSADTLYFVGSTSPLNYFLPTICGTKKLVDEGKKKGAEIIIVDTTTKVPSIIIKVKNICFKVIFSFNNIYPIKMAYNGSITNKIEELIPLVRVTPKKKQILERVIPKNPINKR